MDHAAEDRRWLVILVSCSVGLAIFMQVPQLLRVFNPAWQGVPVQLNSDENYYLPRVMEALSGRPEQAAEAITGEPNIIPLQGAFIESTYGILFRWTGISAAGLLQLFDSILPVGVFLALFWFFRLAGFTKKFALIGSALFILLELYNLGRPIHQRASFLMVLMGINFLIYALEKEWWTGFIASWCMGMLVGVYFWSWTYVWAFWGVLLLWELFEWLYARHHGSEKKHWWSRLGHSVAHGIRRLFPGKHSAVQEYQKRFARWQWLTLFGLVGFFFALPFVLQILRASGHPLFEVAQSHNELYHSRLPESPIRSILFFGMAFGLLASLVRHYPDLRRYKYAIVAVFTACVVLNQQIVHGVVLQFSSHYLFPLVFAGVTCVVICLQHGYTKLLVPFLCAVIFLGGIAYDARYIVTQLTVRSEDFADQHLASLRTVLQHQPRMRILSDVNTSLFIASHTKHDVVYSPYLKHSLISNDELHWRECLTRLFDAMRSEDCADVTARPVEALERFHIDAVAWDESRNPDWDLGQWNVRFEKINGAKGWSLWQVVR